MTRFYEPDLTAIPDDIPIMQLAAIRENEEKDLG
jgi:hypothetical protein